MPPPKLLVTTGRFLGHHIWQGVGAVVAIIALVIAIPAACSAGAGTGGGRPASEVSSAASSPGGISGNCNAQGSNNTVTCANIAPSPASYAEIKPKLGYGQIFAYFDGTPDRLPTPPDYQSPSGHCTDWDSWLRTTPDMYLVDPDINVELQAGEQDLVVLTSITAEIFDRKAPAAGTGVPIQCMYGGGSNSYYEVSVDTVTRKTTVVENPVDGGRPKPMPPASISLTSKGYTDVAVGIRSLVGHLYTGMIVIAAKLNGKDQTYHIGSTERPLRWFATDADLTASHYDWDVTKHAWVKGFNPLGE
jgi:hypothetical protein